MRRQRFAYTLPSQDDSSVLESENASILSSFYSYPDTVWSQVISSEAETCVPYCYYPCYQIPVEQFPYFPSLYDSSLPENTSDNYINTSYYNDDFINISGCSNQTMACDAMYDDRVIADDYSLYDDSFSYENVDGPAPEIPSTYPMVTSYGAVTVLLRHLIRVDISPAKAVYVTNPPANCVACINGNGSRSCIIHPNGRVFHDGSEIQMSTYSRKAKICKKGIIFTSTDHCLSYLVDASGTKTTAEKFRDLNHDFSLEVFYNDSMLNNYVEECYKIVNESEYKTFWNGDEVWFLAGFRIKQDQRGDVKVSRNNGRQMIRSSPTTGQVSIKTMCTEMNIGRYPSNYFYVRRGDKQVTASVKGFNVQNGTQKAGFNSSGKVALF